MQSSSIRCTFQGLEACSGGELSGIEEHLCISVPKEGLPHSVEKVWVEDWEARLLPGKRKKHHACHVIGLSCFKREQTESRFPYEYFESTSPNAQWLKKQAVMESEMLIAIFVLKLVPAAFEISINMLLKCAVVQAFSCTKKVSKVAFSMELL